MVDTRRPSRAPGETMLISTEFSSGDNPARVRNCRGLHSDRTAAALSAISSGVGQFPSILGLGLARIFVSLPGGNSAATAVPNGGQNVPTRRWGKQVVCRIRLIYAREEFAATAPGSSCAWRQDSQPDCGSQQHKRGRATYLLRLCFRLSFAFFTHDYGRSVKKPWLLTLCRSLLHAGNPRCWWRGDQIDGRRHRLAFFYEVCVCAQPWFYSAKSPG
jgi:hypothetical protein